MNKLTISVLVSAVLLPVSVQANDFDDITLQIMDTDSISDGVNNIDFSPPEIDVTEIQPLPESENNSITPEGAGATIESTTEVGAISSSVVEVQVSTDAVPAEFQDGIGGDDVSGELPPSGEIVDELPNDLPSEDISGPIDLGDDIGGGLSGDVPDDLPPLGDITTEIPDELEAPSEEISNPIDSGDVPDDLPSLGDITADLSELPDELEGPSEEISKPIDLGDGIGDGLPDEDLDNLPPPSETNDGIIELPDNSFPIVPDDLSDEIQGGVSVIPNN